MKLNKAMNERALRALDLATLGPLWRRYTVSNMNLSEYYEKAKDLGNKSQNTEILDALNYDDDNDHPSYWVPEVQKALINAYKKDNGEYSDQFLEQYIQGAILQDRAERNVSVKVSLVSLIIGILIGWLFLN